MFNFRAMQLKKMEKVANDFISNDSILGNVIPVNLEARNDRQMAYRIVNSNDVPVEPFSITIPFATLGSYRKIVVDGIEYLNIIQVERVDICMNSIYVIAKRQKKNSVELLKEILDFISRHLHRNLFPRWEYETALDA